MTTTRCAGLQEQLDSVRLVGELALSTGNAALYRAAQAVLAANAAREASERLYGMLPEGSSVGADARAWDLYMMAVDACSGAWATYDALVATSREAA